MTFGIQRLRMMEMVPVMTAKVPVTVRALMRSMPRRKTTIRIRVHNGVEATMGDTTTTRPRLRAMSDRSEPADSKKARQNERGDGAAVEDERLGPETDGHVGAQGDERDDGEDGGEIEGFVGDVEGDAPDRERDAGEQGGQQREDRLPPVKSAGPRSAGCQEISAMPPHHQHGPGENSRARMLPQ